MESSETVKIKAISISRVRHTSAHVCHLGA